MEVDSLNVEAIIIDYGLNYESIFLARELGAKPRHMSEIYFKPAKIQKAVWQDFLQMMTSLNGQINKKLDQNVKLLQLTPFRVILIDYF